MLSPDSNKISDSEAPLDQETSRLKLWQINVGREIEKCCIYDLVHTHK